MLPFLLVAVWVSVWVSGGAGSETVLRLAAPGDRGARSEAGQKERGAALCGAWGGPGAGLALQSCPG